MINTPPHTSTWRAPSARHSGIAPFSRRWHRSIGSAEHKRADLQLRRSNLGDDLLDYVTAGPKLRKWYGQEQRLPKDGGPQKDEEPEKDDEEEADVRDAVLVTDASSATGELVLLQLILNRSRIKAIVRDVADAQRAYGPYVQPGTADVDSPASLVRALRGVRSLVCLGKTGALLQAAKQAGVEHVVLLSMAGASAGGMFGLGALFGGEVAVLRDAAREAALAQCGLPYTIVRASKILDVPGGTSGIRLSAAGSGGGSGVQGISREDLAAVVVQALQHPPPAGGLVVVAEAAGAGAPPQQLATDFQKLVQQHADVVV